MSDYHDLPSEIQELIDAYCDDIIDDDQLQKLEAYLVDHEEARTAFITAVQLHIELRFTVRAGRAADSVLQLIDDSPKRRGSISWRWWTASAAALLIGLGLTASWPKGNRGADVRVRPRPKVGITKSLAMLVKLDEVRWEPSAVSPPTEGDLLAAGRFRFKSGRVTLSMLTGVALVVEGPADLELVSHDSVVCHRGKLRARVPEGAEGFVVTGPGSAVVDLGTEFGLNVHSNGTTQGKVFKGRVQAVLTSETGAYRRTRLIRDGGNAFEMDALTGRINAASAREDFVSPSKPVVKPLVLDRGYRDEILRSGPWAYWRFETMKGGLIPNEVANRPALRVNGPIQLSDPVEGNKSAVFSDGEAHQYLELDGLWGPPRHPGFAVELWFLSETIGHYSLATLLADDPRSPRPKDPSTLHFRFILELTSRVRRMLHQPASVRLLHRFPAAWNDSGDNLYSDQCFVPYRWYHVVGQLNDDRMEIFLDGEPTAPLVVDPTYSNQPFQLLLGRLTTILSDPTPLGKTLDDTKRQLVGRMDEVALYERPLSAEEILHHYRLRRDRSRSD